MKTRLLTIVCMLVVVIALWAQPAETGAYYQKANGKKGRELMLRKFDEKIIIEEYKNALTAYA